MVLARTRRHGPAQIRPDLEARRGYRRNGGGHRRLHGGKETMSRPPLWEPCVSHRAAAAEQFVRDYFGQADRKIKLIAGAGFDPRSTWFPKRLAEAAGARVSAFFLR